MAVRLDAVALIAQFVHTIVHEQGIDIRRCGSPQVGGFAQIVAGDVRLVDSRNLGRTARIEIFVGSIEFKTCTRTCDAEVYYRAVDLGITFACKAIAVARAAEYFAELGRIGGIHYPHA